MTIEKITPDEYPDGVSLRDHFDGRFKELRSLMDDRFRSLAEQTAAAYPNRKEFAELIKEIQDDIHALERSEDKLAGKASQGSTNVALVLAVLSLMIGIISIVMKMWEG